MIIASNTSPILNLAVVGELELLNKLYGKIIISEAVSDEIKSIGSLPPEFKDLGRFPWIEVQAVKDLSLVKILLFELDFGEAHAIAQAVENRADILLIDERLGRRIAGRLGINCIGLLAVLIEAKRRMMIPSVKPILDRLISKAGFWVGRGLYAQVLQEAGE